jgi:hypothetical protein
MSDCLYAKSNGTLQTLSGFVFSKNPNYPRVALRANPGLELANAFGVIPTRSYGVTSSDLLMRCD